MQLCCVTALYVLQVLLHHFSEHQASDDHVDKDTFFKSLGAGGAVCSQQLANILSQFPARGLLKQPGFTFDCVPHAFL